MERDEIGWDRMEWVEMGYGGMERARIGWNGVGWDCICVDMA